MSRFYRELHDRELLAQAVSLFSELEERRLIDVFLPEDQTGARNFFPRRLESITVENGRLALRVETEFFRSNLPHKT